MSFARSTRRRCKNTTVIEEANKTHKYDPVQVNVLSQPGELGPRWMEVLLRKVRKGKGEGDRFYSGFVFFSPFASLRFTFGSLLLLLLFIFRPKNQNLFANLFLLAPLPPTRNRPFFTQPQRGIPWREEGGPRMRKRLYNLLLRVLVFTHSPVCVSFFRVFWRPNSLGKSLHSKQVIKQNRDTTQWAIPNLRNAADKTTLGCISPTTSPGYST